MLSRTNYQEWSVLVQCNLEGMYLWDAIESDKVERRRDRLTLGPMICGVPLEMHSMLLNKKLAKEAWEAIKSMRLEAKHVKEVNAHKLLVEFESISFKLGETIDDFTVCISKLATGLGGLGEASVDDTRVVKRFIRVMPPCYSQVAVMIEMFYELKTMSIEELVGRLRAAEDRFEPTMEQVTDNIGCLLLTKEEWATRNKSRMVPPDMSSSLGRKGGGHSAKKDKSRECGDGSGSSSRDTHDSSVKVMSMEHLDEKVDAGNVACMVSGRRSA